MQGLIVGIDPGFDGAWCVIDQKGGAVRQLTSMPLISGTKLPEYDLAELAQIPWYLACQEGVSIRVIIEKPIPMPRQNVIATARQFAGYGLWLGLLAGYRMELIEPLKWKKALGLSKDKSASLALAALLYPAEMAGVREMSKAKREGLAEALLIAEYGRRTIP